ncbi:hypothetical protein BH10PAT1_BH10PAT1_0760 [soil metagenome]
MNKAQKPLKINSDPTLAFGFLFSNADGFYISARHNLHYGWIAPGCINAHQAIELYIKAILKLDYHSPQGHKLIVTLENFKNVEPYFKVILKNDNIYQFLLELSKAYTTLRYGEGGSESYTKEIIELLDELVFNLRKVYLKKIKSKSTKIYMPKEIRIEFLTNNEYFSESDLTNNIFAQVFPPSVDLPEDFFDMTLEPRKVKISS